ncbi:MULTISPECIES: NAD(P)/FAD-dependent oxidoreductase [Nitrospirillum]|uniref:Thioredoxin reductase n=1 Tax=Nitrospirillum amazonense TaxID=28077 RepID=A0A560EW89_9PROT|nr:NAD(P)/FAD-dependent oxidoreductase [Nitrospirillum amazonense]MEC4594844.1 NAD(P)/FAD-dependent oxidoreductase [Nitrospirillum amazonense]TWB13642.1 thioredoxin reductase [Nitrospirillum amazonense]
MRYDVLIIGGSFAGLSAALQLGRARRRVLVIDAGQRRNRFATTSHGFLGQDGVPPGQIIATARGQLARYATVEIRDGAALGVTGDEQGFVVETDGAPAAGRRLILAGGVTDTLPEVPGLAERWGKHVFHCPYCHGYELNQGPIGVLATGPMSLHHAQMLPDWGPTTLFLNGAFEPDAAQLADLARRGVTVERTPVAGFFGAGADIRLADGRTVPLAGVFTLAQTRLTGPLAAELGVDIEEGPLGQCIQVDAMQQTSVAGVFACGDTARLAGSVALAVASGTMAGTAAHRSLIFTA